MGIAGSFCDAELFQKYFGMRAEWVDMTEIVRRITLGIYDAEEYERALAWVKAVSYTHLSPGATWCAMW